MAKDQPQDVASRIIHHLTYQDGFKDEPSVSHWLLDHIIFKVVIFSLIVLNALQLGLEADYPEWTMTWTACEHGFTAMFLIEALVKLKVLQTAYFRDRWNVLDFALVFMAVFDVWLISPVFVDEALDLQPLSILRIFRIFRLVRVLRLVRHLRKLVLVCQGIIEAMKATLWIAVILTLALYTGAIFCVGLLGGADSGLYPGYSADPAVMDEHELMQNFNPYARFGSMSRAMLTLFNIAILAEWPEVVSPLLEKQPYFIFFFIAFALFVTFGILNVMIAVIVDKVMEHARQMEEDATQAKRDEKFKVLERIQALVSSIDKDGDGRVFHEEIAEYMTHEDSALSVLLREVEVPQGFSPRELVHLLDDNGDGAVVYEEFVQAFYRLVECSPFQHMVMMQSAINSVKFAVNQNHSALIKSHRSTQDRLARLESLFGAFLEASVGTSVEVANVVSAGDDADALVDLAGADGTTDVIELLSQPLCMEEEQLPLPRCALSTSATATGGAPGAASSSPPRQAAALGGTPLRSARAPASAGGSVMPSRHEHRELSAVGDGSQRPARGPSHALRAAEVKLEIPARRVAEAAQFGTPSCTRGAPVWADQPPQPLPTHSCSIATPGQELTEAKASLTS